MSGFSREDHNMVHSYVTANDHLQYQQLPEGIVCICLTHSNLTAQHPDIRLDLHMTIEEVKEKFRKHIGTHVEHQTLVLKDQGYEICKLSDDRRMLGYYSVTSGMEIHVIDTNPFSLSRGGGLTDVTLVEKYRMDDAAYDKRKGTMRDWIRDKRKVDPNYKLKPARMTTMGGGGGGAEKTGFVDVNEFGLESVAGISVGLRAQVMPGARRGVIKFVGEIEQLKSSGYWVGVQFDEPLGRNDGTIKGVKIFDCPDGYGVFARGNNVTVGDFPEKNLMDSDDEDIEDVKPKDEEEEDEI